MSTPSPTAEAARAIAAARLERRPLAPLPGDIAPRDLAQGYAVQAALQKQLEPHLGRRVGWKIGCTSEVMQRYLAIPHPCAGGVYERVVHRSGAQLPAGDYVRVGVECEIAVRLARDPAARGETFTESDVASAIDAYYPAIEIVDDRYVQWETLGAPTLVADDFFAAGIVLGVPVSAAGLPDLLQVSGRALVNGQEIGRGTGADVLGHPHKALAWLANHLAQQGAGLRAGDIVMTGSLVKTAWLQPGDAVQMEFSALGDVHVRIGAAT
jgi:2-keto-4-pentenoate hydratase